VRLEDIEIYNIFDNESQSESLTPFWGFASFIRTPRGNILFDTGSNGRVLLKNLKEIGLDINSIGTIFISHSHWDHIGGLDSILELNPQVDIFLTSHISKNMVRDMRTLAKSVTLIDSTPKQILEGIYSTGIIGREGEQSLILDTERGSIVVSGCAHGGIANIAQRARGFLSKPIYLILGGFHLHNKDRDEILETINTIQALGTKFVSPSHCTGERAKALFQARFANNYIEGGLGMSLNFKK
jgi:7,8-dihydropterin-6-yl-methyl-4-(beta-D-ribofuranosyl)aminobenzene 5'-phosphate synthase